MKERQSKEYEIKTQRYVYKFVAAITGLFYLTGLLVNFDNIKDIGFIVIPAVAGLICLVPILEYFYKLPMSRVPAAGFMGIEKVKERKFYLVYFSILYFAFSIFLIKTYILSHI
jgi:hypothetical protein